MVGIKAKVVEHLDKSHFMDEKVRFSILIYSMKLVVHLLREVYGWAINIVRGTLLFFSTLTNFSKAMFQVKETGNKEIKK